MWDGAADVERRKAELRESDEVMLCRLLGPVFSEQGGKRPKLAVVLTTVLWVWQQESARWLT